MVTSKKTVRPRRRSRCRITSRKEYLVITSRTFAGLQQKAQGVLDREQTNVSRAVRVYVEQSGGLVTKGSTLAQAFIVHTQTFDWK
jgi:hypothetical protein